MFISSLLCDQTCWLAEPEAYNISFSLYRLQILFCLYRVVHTCTYRSGPASPLLGKAAMLQKPADGIMAALCCMGMYCVSGDSEWSAGYSGVDSDGCLGSAHLCFLRHCAQLAFGCSQQGQSRRVQSDSAARQRQWGVSVQHCTPALSAWHLLVSPPSHPANQLLLLLCCSVL